MSTLNDYMRTPIRLGLVTTGIFILLFVVWGAFAPISSGVVAAGKVSPEGYRRTVQHLEGGIISELLVANGTMVNADDPIILLGATRAETEVGIVRSQRHQLRARVSRLQAERDGDPALSFTPDLVSASQLDPSVQAILDSENALFVQRTSLHQNRREMLQSQIAQLREEITGLNSQIRAQNEQVSLIQEESDATRSLVDRGLAPRPRLLALLRQRAAIQERSAANSASIASARQAIGEAQIQLLAIEAERLDDVSSQLNEALGQIAVLDQRLRANQDVLTRTVITAPISGRIVNLNHVTHGGVISPGEDILDIVPLDERLIIDANIRPSDVDVVYPGLPVIIHFSGLPQRQMPRVTGAVLDVSADALVDEASGEAYYAVRVSVGDAELNRIATALGEDAPLLPGMPAEILITTGERTFAEYLLEPLSGSLRRAVRES